MYATMAAYTVARLVLHSLEELKRCGYLDMETAVLKLQLVDGQTNLVASPLLN